MGAYFQEVSDQTCQVSKKPGRSKYLKFNYLLNQTHDSHIS